MSIRDGKIVSAYLNSLSSGKGRGAQTPAKLKSQLDRIVQKLDSNVGKVTKLKLIQKQIELKRRLGAAEKAQNQNTSRKKLEDDFIVVAAAYSRENNISNTAWRRIGVPGSVLIKAGLAEPRKRSK